MPPRVYDLTRNPDQIEHLVRILSASINVEILRILTEARASDPDGGWLFLSEIAEKLNEKPGTVGMAVQKLLPLLEERREKGKRYFRSRVREFAVHVDLAPVEDLLA